MLGEFKVPGKRFVELLLLIKFSPGSNLGPKFIHGDRKRKARMGSLHENGGEQGWGEKLTNFWSQPVFRKVPI